MRFSYRALLFCGGLFSDGRFSFRASRDAVNGEGALRRSSNGRAFVYRSTIRPVVHPPSTMRSKRVPERERWKLVAQVWRKHVGAEPADPGSCLKTFEELADRVAREGPAAAVSEQCILGLIVALAIVGDVRVERFEGLEGKVDVACVDRFGRRGSDVQAPLTEVDVAEAKACELLPAETAPQERPDNGAVAFAALALSGAFEEMPHLVVSEGAAALVLHLWHAYEPEHRLTLVVMDPLFGEEPRHRYKSALNTPVFRLSQIQSFALPPKKASASW